MSLFRLDQFRNRRKSPRYEVHYLGQIDLGREVEQLSCIICDISETGARLAVGQDVPDEFMLVFKRRCLVRRRDEDGEVAVEFIPA
jgi:PilZ domain